MLNAFKRLFVGRFKNKPLVAEESELQESTAIRCGRTPVVDSISDAGLASVNKVNHQIFDRQSLDFYKILANKKVAGSLSVPFVLLDSKSLPRSGLHYMKGTFSKLLGDNFSFCEWYHEPGCCKKMPCKIRGFAECSERTATPKLRLLKSHDFHLVDPVYEPNIAVRRIVLLRDPLYVLTSWYALDQLANYKETLFEHGIRIEKICMFHESEVTSAAYEAIDSKFVEPELKHLQYWLSEKYKYISGFLAKWLGSNSMGEHCRVVRYEEINDFVYELTQELYPFLADGPRERVDKEREAAFSGFRPRGDSWSCASVGLSEFYRKNREYFEEVSSKINKKFNF